MSEVYVITKPGILKRKDNTITFYSKSGTYPIPIESIDAIILSSEVSFNSRVIRFLAEKGVVLHILGYFGKYYGSFVPQLIGDGSILVKQAFSYTERRLEFAKAFVEGASANMLRNLVYYHKKKKIGEESIIALREYKNKIFKSKSVNSLRGVEGNIRRVYFKEFDNILLTGFDRRTRNPPKDFPNALLSWLYSLLYSFVATGIVRSGMTPSIGFLHELYTGIPLVLDLSEIFKPLVDRVFFKAINKKMITQEMCESSNGGIYLNRSGRIRASRLFLEKVNETVWHPELKRYTSYRGVLNYECRKLARSIENGDRYVPVRI